ncbi:hypothetical protein DNTS_003308 [Danionella cerebrum]|uniref:RIMB1/RIM3A-C-like N-terminal domain-containing protein n=1 Tax=Danionella cerebrum TaxID=2873325 RepID=A0A553MVL6_9TELE|nr:hypothetical protein DNTS_003308 [Danionella translucida]
MDKRALFCSDAAVQGVALVSANWRHLRNGDYGLLVRQNSELLRALEETEKSCTALREENRILRKSSSPETEEKVKRLRKKNAELALIAKRLEERAHKLQEANLKVVNSPLPVRAGAVEQYKRAFARQRARDLAQHADTLLRKDKQIAALQRRHQAPVGSSDVQRLLSESQKEVLRLQRQLSVSSAQKHSSSPQQEVRETNSSNLEFLPDAFGKGVASVESRSVRLLHE